MSITFEDARDVVRYIIQHPELLSELRPHVLSEELLNLPDQMREWQAESNERFERLEAAIAENSRHIERLLELQDRFEARMTRFEGRMGNIDGSLLEDRYRNRLHSSLGWLLRRPALADMDEIVDRLDEVADITQQEINDVQLLDFVVSGVMKKSGERVLLGGEASRTINTDDVERAVRRTALLKKAGYNAVPFVGGHFISNDARELAAQTPELVVDIRPLPEL